MPILSFTNLSLIIIGPLLYEYAFQFFNTDNKKSFKQKKKYILFIACSCLLFSSYIFLSSNVYTYILSVTTAVSLISLIFYLVKLMRYQIKSTKNLKNYYASLADKNLFWINILIVGLLVVLVLDSILGVIIISTGIRLIAIINTIFLLVLIWYLGYYGLTQEAIKHNINELDIPIKTEVDLNLCETQDYQELKNRLCTLMEEKELYKLDKINLFIVSQHLDIPIKKTSYLLNHCMDTTFYDFINKFRMEEFKLKVANGELNKKTILALALESGFNSKATFNRIFKRKEKVSPIQFVKSQKKLEN